METVSSNVRNILVPTDFSANCRNVANYAAALCRFTGARMILFHVYHPPAMISEIPGIHPFEGIEEICQVNMERIVSDLRSRHGESFEIEQKCQCGFAVEEIRHYQEHNPVDLIVMGMKEAGYLSERLIGSVTTSLIYQAGTPVLAVGEQVRYKPVRKIVLACDFSGSKDYSRLQTLKSMARLFGAHIYVLNVVQDPDTEINANASARQALDAALEGTSHSYHYSGHEDIVEGISEFIRSMDIDLAVMIPRSHSFLENILHEPSTKRMAFHADVPLLTLHEPG